jgi:hypothetical protein
MNPELVLLAIEVRDVTPSSMIEVKQKKDTEHGGCLASAAHGCDVLE